VKFTGDADGNVKKAPPLFRVGAPPKFEAQARQLRSNSMSIWLLLAMGFTVPCDPACWTILQSPWTGRQQCRLPDSETI